MAALRKRTGTVKVGDVFEVPSPDGRRGYGQVVVAGKVLYVVIFGGLYEEAPELDALVAGEPLLVGWTLDGLIHHRTWKIVGNRPPNIGRVPFPSYKVRVEGIPYVHSFDGTSRRPATDRQWDLLENKTTVAPIRFQNALLARHGLAEWREDYESLTVEHAARRVLNDSVRDRA